MKAAIQASYEKAKEYGDTNVHFVDGETFFAREVEMKLAEEKIRFFYPKGLSWRNAECTMQNAK